jgi:hypothetical protein
LAPQHDADSMRIRRFALSWKGNPSFNRVEQILEVWCVEDLSSAVIQPLGAGQ